MDRLRYDDATAFSHDIIYDPAAAGLNGLPRPQHSVFDVPLGLRKKKVKCTDIMSLLSQGRFHPDCLRQYDSSKPIRELKSTVAHVLQNTEPNLRRFSVAKCSAVVKRSKISPLPLFLSLSLSLSDDARRISCLNFYARSYLSLNSAFLIKLSSESGRRPRD